MLRHFKRALNKFISQFVNFLDVMKSCCHLITVSGCTENCILKYRLVHLVIFLHGWHLLLDLISKLSIITQHKNINWLNLYSQCHYFISSCSRNPNSNTFWTHIANTLWEFLIVIDKPLKLPQFTMFYLGRKVYWWDHWTPERNKKCIREELKRYLCREVKCKNDFVWFCIMHL